MFDTPPLTAWPLLQDAAFGAALRRCGQHPVMLPGGLMVLHRRICGMPVAMLPRAAPPADLRAQLRAVGLHHVPMILSPETACAVPSALRLRRPRQRLIINLTAGPERHLHPKWRNQWRKALRAGLQVQHTRLPPDPTHPLFEAETAQRQRRGYTGWPAALTAAFAAAAPEQTRLLCARERGKVVAQMLFLRHGDTVTYHIGHITPAGRALCAHNLLLMQACTWFADQGCRQMDLGLLEPANPGLTRFKMRAGAVAEPTGGTWLAWHPLARRAGS